MKQYSFERKPSEQASAGPHPDYQKNLQFAESFCAKVKPSLLKGMNIKVVDGEHIPKALMIISWKPGLNEPKGNYATPICLHQYAEDFKKTTTNVLNCYMSSVKTHQDRNPDQPDFFKENYIKV